ncbi:uncharacterized protein LOC131158645 [Malania oleifera]|uniref:uncharacterized protein LOC131158645 n=1 Tax=Malania oleifera TaxID=397392 RepID=UPI0025ADA47C|nr:uncharacterized protein LOC131158645 [Malania oleifera]
MEFSPALEVSAVNYLCYGLTVVINNLWPCVAVIVAALSFWRIRFRAADSSATAAGSSLSIKPDPPTCAPADSDRNASDASASTSPLNSTSEDRPVSAPAVLLASSAAAAPATSLECDAEDDCGVVTKGNKFRLYYEDGKESTVVGGSGGSTAWNDDVLRGGGGGVSVSWWERSVGRGRRRSGEMGWCRCQDLTVINGSVVRLWDDGRGFMAIGS